MGKNAFVDSAGVLLAWGFVETNAPGDVRVPVSDDFHLMPGEWQWSDGEWIAYVPPDVPGE